MSGFGIALSLIVAIGAQNAFVLKQGLQRSHVLLVCTLCVVSDAILIAVGVYGFDYVVATTPWFETVARYGGIVFLLVYGILSFRSALVNQHALDATRQNAPSSALKVAAICLAFTWLNPHVYIDTVLLLGSVSVQFEATKNAFFLGAVTSSTFFFYTLGYSARFLTPIFTKPITWKIVETAIGILMCWLAVQLLKDSFG